MNDAGRKVQSKPAVVTKDNPIQAEYERLLEERMYGRQIKARQSRAWNGEGGRLRAVRVPEALWIEAGHAAERLGVSKAEVVREGLRQVVAATGGEAMAA